MRIPTLAIAALASSLVGAKRLLPEKHISPHALAKAACLEHNTPESCDRLIQLDGGELLPALGEREARIPGGIAMGLESFETVSATVTAMGESIGRYGWEIEADLRVAIPTTLATVVVGRRGECLQLGGCGVDAFGVGPVVEREARIPHAITGNLDILETVHAATMAIRESIDQRERETITDVNVALPTTMARVLVGHREKLPCLQLGGCGEDAFTMPPFVEREARIPDAVAMDFETVATVPVTATAIRESTIGVRERSWLMRV